MQIYTIALKFKIVLLIRLYLYEVSVKYTAGQVLAIKDNRVNKALDKVNKDLD